MQKPRSQGVPRDYGEVALPPGGPERLAAYEDLVRRWAPRLDLVSPTDLSRFHERHIADALKAVSLLASLGSAEVVDVGSGAGLPGIPLAVALPARKWTLLEPRRARAAFLEEVVRNLELDVEVKAQSAEEVARTEGAVFGIATARALAPPAETFALLTPLLNDGGPAVGWVGRGARLPANSGLWAEGLATMPRRPTS